jgi:hypothetical protein
MLARFQSTIAVLAAVVTLTVPALSYAHVDDGSCAAASASPAAASVMDLSAAAATSSSSSHHESLGSHLWSFAKGAAIGFATGVAIGAGVAVLAATAPVWVAGAVIAGLGALTLVSAVQLARSWDSYDGDTKAFVAGNVVGGVLSGGVRPARLPLVGSLLARGATEPVGATVAAVEHAPPPVEPAAVLPPAEPAVLNLGSGSRPVPGATNLDVEQFHDAAGKPLVDVIGDARATGLPDASYDQVVATKLPSPIVGQHGPQLAAEVFRVLKPRGTVRITCVTPALRAADWIAAGFHDVKVDAGGSLLRATK